MSTKTDYRDQVLLVTDTGGAATVTPSVARDSGVTEQQATTTQGELI